MTGIPHIDPEIVPCSPSPLPARIITFLLQQCIYNHLSITCVTTYLKYVLYKHLLVETLVFILRWLPLGN